MYKFLYLKSLCVSMLQADPNQLEAQLDNGLIMGHAYSITAVSLVSCLTFVHLSGFPLLTSQRKGQLLCVQNLCATGPGDFFSLFFLLVLLSSI